MKNEKEVISKDYQLDIEKLNSEIKYNKHELIKLKDEYEKRIEKMRLQWIKMIAERIHYLEAYLKILDKRIIYNNNIITIIYKINKNEDFIKIFDEDFVEAKKDFCKILYEGKEYELQENFDVKNINKNSDLLEIKLKITKKITSFFSMFYKCKSLLFLPDISKFDTSNIVNMNDMFCECSSLIFLSDISKWNTSKLERTAEMFYGCSSLTFLPDISKWDTSKIKNMNSMFYGCKSLLYLPDISKWNIKNVETKKNIFGECDESLKIPKEFQ